MDASYRASIDISIRHVSGPSEMRLVEELQKEVWGVPDLDVVPLTQLVAANAAGGVLLGAFDADTMIGFVYGFVGLENGRMTHHSHMLAVRPAYRNSNVGYKLKLAQREYVLAQGIEEMTWTFDPLQSLNAYFNFNRLGVFANRYLTDFYGTDPESFLHQTGTDRLWVTWPVNSRRVEERIAKMRATSELDKASALVEVGGSNEPIVHEMRRDIANTRLCIEIPRDIVLLERENKDLARRWREATRQAFLGAIAAGFLVIDFVRGEGMGRYQLEHSTAHPELAAFGSAKL